MTPESKQLAAVIATAVATAMAGKSASPDSTMFAYIEGKIQKEALYLQVTSMDGTKGKSTFQAAS